MQRRAWRRLRHRLYPHVMSVVVTAAQIAACLGWGAFLLAVLGVRGRTGTWERFGLAFSLGMGILGWLLFWPGISAFFTPAVMAAILAFGWVGLAFLKVEIPRVSPIRVGWGVAAMVVVVLVQLGLDIVEVLSPAMDADSLAYHYDLPRRFLEQGAVQFVPRAVDGAVPLLIQMTYAPLMALGGHKAPQVWAMATTWIAAAFLFGLARKHVGDHWAAITAIIFLGTPAVVYGGGTGQAEVRMALFVLSAAYALGRWRTDAHLGWAAVAGLCCGFLMGSKFTGLLFAAAGGVLVLALPRRWIGALVFGSMALAAGFQWYGWNFLHTGDPVFPMLFPWLGVSDPRFWNPEVDSLFRQLFLGSETPLPRNLTNFFAYPFIATFDPSSALESGRTGLGPTVVMAFPMMLWGAWRHRRRLASSPLLPMAGFVFLFYCLWFPMGGSQRVRHLLPLWPLLLLLMAAGCRRAMDDGFGLIYAKGIVAGVIALQLAGAVLGNRWYLTHLGQPDAAYFRPVSGYYPVAEWANSALKPGEKLLNPYREINFLLNVPFYHSHPVDQALVDILPSKADSRRFWEQLRALAITHVPAAPSLSSHVSEAQRTPLWMILRHLSESGCAQVVATLHGRQVESKSTGGAEADSVFDILRLTPEHCPYEAER